MGAGDLRHGMHVRLLVLRCVLFCASVPTNRFQIVILQCFLLCIYYKGPFNYYVPMLVRFLD